MINYIVTSHNSEGHIAMVLSALMQVRKSPTNPIYCVLDGCTDGTESVVRRYPVKIITTPDVYEMRCLNIAFREIPQPDDGLNFILQDDVVLTDPDTEMKIDWLYRLFPGLGIVGMRHGFNLPDDALTSGEQVPSCDKIENDHNIPGFRLPGYAQLANGCFTYRQMIYKSPIVIPCKVVNTLGGYDERFAPTAHDDTEFAMRACRAGFKNGIVAIDVCQPMDWRGSSSAPVDFTKLHIEHMNLIRELYPDLLRELGHARPSTLEMRLWPSRF